MKAITELRKTAWYVLVPVNPNDPYSCDTFHEDAEGHIYFSEEIARQIGRDLRIVPHKDSRKTVKTVVVDYAPDPDEPTCSGGV